eukprot:CAMPEP_0202877670 /NCGR_PEP_ID=MMETSP1391-20130828/31010_1 /ASSEMBLY_ACC=CAM_ASM_000867 /TAXON_ID=1034604 /ORGANISM="Chlamydomonas leiostraca, Strain SAG 11-49" /LENGTH=317 /DNA_ID=CAMNT_0049559749 /DNA_START=77 /DNA_END=1030 /DNA_ORIENTATION=+
MSADPLSTRCVRAGDAEKLHLLKNYDGFIFDLDGTLWKGSTLIPGAKEVLDLLRAQGKHLFFVTNNATKSRTGVLKKMTSLGLTAYEEEVMGSAHAAAVYLKSKKVQKAYVVGELGLVEELSAVGVKVLGGPADSGKSWDWSGDKDPVLSLDPEVGAVVVGLDRAVNYYKLQHACAYITQNKALFVACNTDARGNLASTDEWAGAGTMVAAVIGCSEAEPVVCGKPNTLIMDLLAKSSGISRNRMCVVGDRLDTDILWGERCGAGTLCVLTGCTSEAQLLSPTNTIQPNYYVDSLADLLSVKSQLGAGWDASSCALM